MQQGRLGTYWTKARAELRRAFAEQHTPHEVAGSFAIGVFVTTLPTGGLGLGLFWLLTRLSARISSIAIFSSVLVINPLVKAPMYVAAFWVGSLIFGRSPTSLEASAEGAVSVALMTVSGFVVFGIGVAIVGYAIVYGMTRAYQARELHIVDELVDDELLAERDR